MTLQCDGVSATNNSQNISDLSIERSLSAKIKGIAILLVIFGHMNYIDCAGAWGVHLFLIISGYGITVSLEQSGSNKYWRKRIKSVYLPYLLSTIVFLTVRLFLNEKISPFSVAVSLIGFDFGRNLDQTMWYISYIFVWYAIAWLLYLLRNKNYFFISGVGAGALVLMAALGYASIIWRRGTIAWAYFASFPFGMLLAECRNKKLSLSIKNSLLAVVVGICLAIVCLDYRKPHSGIDELVFTFSAALGVLSVIVLVNTNTKIGRGGVIQKIGSISYFMYLNEGFLLEHKKIFVPIKNVNIQNLCILALSILLAICMNGTWKVVMEKTKKGRSKNAENITSG